MKIAALMLLVLILAGVAGYLYINEPDPNVYDAQIIVQISEAESKRFEFNIDELRIVSSTITQYLNTSQNIAFLNNYPALHGTGKKPSGSIFKSGHEDKTSGKYIIQKTSGGFSMIYEKNQTVMRDNIPLEEAVLDCCGAIWNTMNVNITIDRQP